MNYVKNIVIDIILMYLKLGNTRLNEAHYEVNIISITSLRLRDDRIRLG